MSDIKGPDFVSKGTVLNFSNSYKEATAFVKGATVGKLIDLPYDSRIKLNGFKSLKR